MIVSNFFFFPGDAINMVKKVVGKIKFFFSVLGYIDYAFYLCFDIPNRVFWKFKCFFYVLNQVMSPHTMRVSKAYTFDFVL